MSDQRKTIEPAVVKMYSCHPSPSIKDKLAYVSRRMDLRLLCCGVSEKDYKGKSVLDAGCGTGEYSCWLASRGAQVTGIDLSDGSLEEAKHFAEKENLRVSFEKRSILETGFSDGSFDFVYCTGVLHHTKDPYGGLSELCRILRPNGKILISLYNSFGFLPREVRRRIALFFGGKDLNKRVRWGRRLFPFTTKRLLREHRNDSQSALFDYFAIPHESLHSLGQILGWYDRLGLEYQGCFPPPRIRDYPSFLSQREYKLVEKDYQSMLGRLIARMGAGKKIRCTRPGAPSRLLVQALWFASGIGMFSICGQKK